MYFEHSILQKEHPAMVVLTNNIKNPAAEDVLYKKDVRS